MMSLFSVEFFLCAVSILFGVLVTRLFSSSSSSPPSSAMTTTSVGGDIWKDSMEIVKGKEVNIDGHTHYRYVHPLQRKGISDDSVERLSADFYQVMRQRRSIRYFSNRPVRRAVIDNIIKTAGTAPSGANKQPWTFVVVSDPDIKHQIRVAAEKEEYVNYEGGRMNEKWQDDLKKFATTWKKEYIDIVPYLIVAFKQTYGVNEDGSKDTHYYFERSIGIATGMLITAIHQCGLCTLTHTPTPMGFLSRLLERPANEKPYLLLPVGYAADDCTVPDIPKKSLEEITVYH